MHAHVKDNIKDSHLTAPSKYPYVLLIIVFMGSFYDEIASFLFSFSQADSQNIMGISFLLSGTMLGGVSASFFMPYILGKMRQKNIVVLTFLLASIVLYISSFLVDSAYIYLIAMTLGFLNGMFFVSINAYIRRNFIDDNLLKVNSLVQAIKNSGYIAGPTIAGILYMNVGIKNSFLFVIVINIIALVLSYQIKDSLENNKDALEENQNHKIAKTNSAQADNESKSQIPSAQQEVQDKAQQNQSNAVVQDKSNNVLKGMYYLLTINKIWFVFLPLLLTVIFSSAFNVIYMYIALVDLGFTKVQYGILTGSITVGLVAGPVLLSKAFAKMGLASGICFCSGIIGLCMYLLSITNNFYYSVIALCTLGLCNGVLNSLLSTLIMKLIPDGKIDLCIPAFSLIMQSFVLFGLLLPAIFPTNTFVFLGCSGLLILVVGMMGAFANKAIKNY